MALAVTFILVEYVEKSDSFIIKDYSEDILDIFGFNEDEELFGTDFQYPGIMSLLHIVNTHNMSHIESNFNIANASYITKIYCVSSTMFNIVFQPRAYSAELARIEKPSNSESLIDDYFIHELPNDFEEFYSNDKDLEEIIKLKDKDAATLNLEQIYLLNKIRDRLKDLEDNMVSEEDFSMSALLVRFGLKNIILFLLVMSIVETLLLERLIEPTIDIIQNTVIELLTDPPDSPGS